jgi:hypothetical protein
MSPAWWACLGVLTNQHEITVIGDEHLLVLAPIACYLLTFGDHPGILSGTLDLNDAAGRDSSLRDFPASGALDLIGRKESSIRYAGSAILKVDHAAHARLQSLADSIEQIGNSRVVRGFFNGVAATANIVKIAEVFFQ